VARSLALVHRLCLSSTRELKDGAGGARKGVLMERNWRDDSMHAPSEDTRGLEVCRDATYPRETQEQLRDLLREQLSRADWNGNPRVHALADVIRRWDRNAATETTFPLSLAETDLILAETEAYVAGMKSALGMTR
jgi:hypothetical protein